MKNNNCSTIMLYLLRSFISLFQVMYLDMAQIYEMFFVSIYSIYVSIGLWRRTITLVKQYNLQKV